MKYFIHEDYSVAEMSLSDYPIVRSLLPRQFSKYHRYYQPDLLVNNRLNLIEEFQSEFLVKPITSEQPRIDIKSEDAGGGIPEDEMEQDMEDGSWSLHDVKTEIFEGSNVWPAKLVKKKAKKKNPKKVKSGPPDPARSAYRNAMKGTDGNMCWQPEFLVDEETFNQVGSLHFFPH